MSELVTVAGRISSYYAQILSNASLPPLEGGGIYLGREFAQETETPPRVVMIPLGGSFDGPKAVGTLDQSTIPGELGVIPHHADRLRARPLWTEKLDFECHFYIAATPNDPLESIKLTQTYYQLFLKVCYDLTSSQFTPKTFVWESQQPNSLTKVGAGQHFVMTMTLTAPVTDLGVNFAPANVKPKNFVSISSSTP